jgi:hypothetical protein
MEFKEAFRPIRALKSTFEAMNLQPAHLWGGALLLMFIEQIAGMGFNFIAPVVESFGEEVLIYFIAGSCIAMLGLYLLATWLYAGLLATLRSVIQTGEVGEGGLFDHRGKFVPLILTRIFVGLCSIVLSIPGIALAVGAFFYAQRLSGGQQILIVIVGGIAGYLLILYAVVGLMLAEPAVIFERLSPTEAIGRSWRLVRGHRWRMILFLLVNMIFTLLGILMCCVGMFATGSIARLATSEAYLKLTAGESPASEPTFNSEADEDRAVHLD